VKLPDGPITIPARSTASLAFSLFVGPDPTFVAECHLYYDDGRLGEFHFMIDGTTSPAAGDQNKESP
jgi:hypothetical protein